MYLGHTTLNFSANQQNDTGKKQIENNIHFQGKGVKKTNKPNREAHLEAMFWATNVLGYK